MVDLSPIATKFEICKKCPNNLETRSTQKKKHQNALRAEDGVGNELLDFRTGTMGRKIREFGDFVPGSTQSRSVLLLRARCAFRRDMHQRGGGGVPTSACNWPSCNWAFSGTWYNIFVEKYCQRHYYHIHAHKYWPQLIPFFFVLPREVLVSFVGLAHLSPDFVPNMIDYPTQSPSPTNGRSFGVGPAMQMLHTTLVHGGYRETDATYILCV